MMLGLSIWSMFLNAIGGVFGFVIGLLPTVPLPDLSGVGDSLGPVFAGFAWANNYAPVDLLLVLAGMMLGTQAAIATVNLVLWVLTKLHILGGSS